MVMVVPGGFVLPVWLTALPKDGNILVAVLHRMFHLWRVVTRLNYDLGGPEGITAATGGRRRMQQAFRGQMK